ncbi:MAG: ASPIC/UnbV domain-containing protein, partial [Acidobacteriota bacterium]
LPKGRFTSVLPADLDGDGDLDLVAARHEGPPVLLRNEGGNRNHWLRLTLRGKNDSNAKNNTQGLFTKIEVRAGTAYQARLGNGGVNHLGLGSQRQAQVLRVVWTNGVSQTWRMVAADRTMDEKQVLKGSCPFLYAWNGTAFDFVTDVMWTSPLGMLRDDGSRASHLSARDFVKIPGGALHPAGDALWLQLTEELWETVYVDRTYLLALDHPAGVEMIVDETFRQPKPSPDAPVHWVGRRLEPAAAVDQGGNDVRDRIRARDGRRVDDLPLTRYQGLTSGHHLDLTFTDVPAGERLRLLLWGWIFPTDTSINRALSQNAALSGHPPSLELREGDRWRTLIPSIGVPNGKRKAMVVELTDRLPAGTVTLRIATNLQIYWDAAALAVGEPAVAPVVTRLEPAGGNLHYRGYSRLFRDSATGPHLFDYGEVRTGYRFRDMTGAFTRYGDVTELLEAEDDRYVVLNAGDELTVVFPAGALPPVPAGWVRDWSLYTDGWVKDADINTAFSASVGPLPYHGMNAYPDEPRHRYPSDPEHLRYLTHYQTRWVTDEPFRDALKPGPAEDP